MYKGDKKPGVNSGCGLRVRLTDDGGEDVGVADHASGGGTQPGGLQRGRDTARGQEGSRGKMQLVWVPTFSLLHCSHHQWPFEPYLAGGREGGLGVGASGSLQVDGGAAQDLQVGGVTGSYKGKTDGRGGATLKQVKNKR